MKKYFGTYNVEGHISAIAGIDSTSLVIPFVPDYIKVEIEGPHVDDEDQIFWDLMRTDDSSYQIDIAWSLYADRRIHYRIAQLTIDPV